MEKWKERRKWYLDNGICPRCGHRELQDGYKLCLECRTAGNERRRARYTPQLGQYPRHKALREKRKAQGLCPNCGKRKPTDGKVNCNVCLAKNKAARHKYDAKQGRISTEQRLSGYYCYHCAEELPEWRENKLCDKCMAEMTARAREMRKHVDYEHHPFGRAAHKDAEYEKRSQTNGEPPRIDFNALGGKSYPRRKQTAYRGNLRG